MAIVSVSPFLVPEWGYHDWLTYSAFLLDAATEKYAMVFRAPKDGSIATIGFKLGVVTTGDTLRVSLQNVDPATGNPDGTADQSGTVVVASADDNTWKTAILGSARVVTLGELLCLVIDFNSFVAGNLEIQAIQAAAGGSRYGFQNSCYNTHQVGGSWTKSVSTLPCIDIAYNDGSRAHIIGNVPF
jgi:hypothetical protein